MKFWCTEIRAINPSTGQLRTFSGPHVPGISWKDAEEYCENNGLGYCKVIGELIAEIPCNKETYEPDWKKQIDYYTPQMN